MKLVFLKNIMLIYLLLTLLGSCNNDHNGRSAASQITGTTDAGYPYSMHKQHKGPRPKSGDKIRFARQIRLGQDSILAGFREIVILIPDKVQIPDPPPADLEMFLLMAEGDSATVYVPGSMLQNMPRMKYGLQDTLIYDIVLYEILATREELALTTDPVEEAKGRAVQGAKAYMDGLLGGVLKSTPSGLKYLPTRSGDGRKVPSDATVTVNYYAVNSEGDHFDDSYSKGGPYTFKRGSNQVMPGWDEGMAYVEPGGSMLLVIPSDLAYGKAGLKGMVKPDEPVIIYVELLDFK
jgi:FKBP-type peptidyl-prolyl cis-trans isomerase